MQRLQSTVVLTTIRHGANWRRMQFSWINEWEELVDARGHCHGMEFVLPEWFYRGVLDRSLVLTIDPAYFALTGGIERWLYRLARRHAGHQRHGWAFELKHLHAKSGSAARFSDFALDVRRIVRRQSVARLRPAYSSSRTGAKLLRAVPRQFSTGTVDGAVEAIRRSGARTIRRSGARLSADQAHGPQLSLWPATRNGARNNSNSRESNSSVVGGENLGTPADGAARPSRPIGGNDYSATPAGAAGAARDHAASLSEGAATDGYSLPMGLRSVRRWSWSCSPQQSGSDTACRSSLTISGCGSDSTDDGGHARLLPRTDRALAAVWHGGLRAHSRQTPTDHQLRGWQDLRVCALGSQRVRNGLVASRHSARAQCRRNRCDRPRNNSGRRNPVAGGRLATREARI